MRRNIGRRCTPTLQSYFLEPFHPCHHVFKPAHLNVSICFSIQCGTNITVHSASLSWHCVDMLFLHCCKLPLFLFCLQLELEVAVCEWISQHPIFWPSRLKGAHRMKLTSYKINKQTEHTILEKRRRQKPAAACHSSQVRVWALSERQSLPPFQSACSRFFCVCGCC